MDIFPTLCDICNITIPDSVEGISLKPILDGDSNHVRDHVFCAYRNYQRPIRNDKFKLIEYYVNGNRHTQLFNMEEDPYELNNLAGDPEYSVILKYLRSELLQAQVDADDPLVCKTPEELAIDLW